jgi:tetratricopeptide (TPR) repeat protein
MRHKKYAVALTVPLATLLLVAPPASAELMFLDGGYGELCATAARQAIGPQPPQYYSITGSRVGLTALEVCNRAVNGYDGSNENVAESYNNRGVIWFQLGDLEAALADFGRAIREQGSMAQAHVNHGYTLVALERWQEAVTAFSRGLELGTEEAPKARYNRGVAFEETGLLREAYADYQAAAELDPAWEAPRQELQRFTVIRR